MIRYDQTQPTSAIIKVKVSGELQPEEFNNILAFFKVAVGSQGKCRVLMVVGISTAANPESRRKDDNLTACRRHASTCNEAAA